MSLFVRINNWRTAAAYNLQGSGCSSFYWLPPLSVLFFGRSSCPGPAAHIPSQTAAIHGEETPPSTLSHPYSHRKCSIGRQISSLERALQPGPQPGRDDHADRILRQYVCTFLGRSHGTFSGYAGSFRRHGRSIRSRYQRLAWTDIFAARVRSFKPKYFMVTGGI